MSKRAKAIFGLGLLIVLAFAAVPTLSSGKGSVSATAAKTVTIKVGDNWYKPVSTSVPAGTTVTWKWVGKIKHSVTSTSGPQKFDSKLKPSGASYSVKLTKKGTVKYICSIHPEQKGTIKVT